MRRVALLVVGATASCLLAACNGLGSDDGETAPAPGAGDWAGLGLPYGGPAGEGSTDYHLGYRDASVIVETEVSGDPGDPGYDDKPYPALVSMTATAGAGLFTFEVRNGSSEVWRLAPDGDWDRIARQVIGIPMTDLGGHHAFWTAREDDPHVFAYSTEEEKVVGKLPVFGDQFVYAVDDDTAYVVGDGDQRLWTVGAEPREETLYYRDFRAGVGDVVVELRDDFRSVGLVRDAAGEVILEDPRLESGILDPEGSAVVLVFENLRRFEVRTFPELSPVQLAPQELLESRPSVRSFSWTTDGRLVIEGGDPPRTLLCTVPEGECEEIANREEGYVGRLGQVLRAEPEDGP